MITASDKDALAGVPFEAPLGYLRMSDALVSISLNTKFNKELGMRAGVKKLLSSLFLFTVALSAQAQGVSKDEILIGGVGPITGPAAYIGLGEIGRAHV